MAKSFLFILVFQILSITLNAQSDQLEFDGMNNTKMGEILNNIGESVEGELGNWQVLYGSQVLFVLTDEAHNRMRIFTPIAEQKNLKEGEMEAMLAANFHAALDAKYALYGGFVVSLFTHPLNELTPDQFKDAVKQVAVAGQNFGTTYSSTDLIFGGGTTEEAPTTSEEDKKINQKPKKKT